MISVVRYPRYLDTYRRTKYRETAQVSRVSTILCSSYHLATCTLQACDAETNSKVTENHTYHSTTMSARAAVNKYNPISYFCISTALLTTLTKLPISKSDLVLLRDLWRWKIRKGTKKGHQTNYRSETVKIWGKIKIFQSSNTKVQANQRRYDWSL